MTVEDKFFNIKNGLSVGTGKHQVLDSNAHLNVNYVTLNTGGRYLSAGVDLWDLIATHGIPPLSTNSWNEIHDQFLHDKPRWDDHLSWTASDSATNNTDYNRSVFVNVSGDDILGPVHIKDTFSVDEETYLRGHLRVDGHTYLSAAMYVENDAYVMGDLRVDGNVWLASEEQYDHYVYVGSSDGDNVVFHADVDSNMTPNIDVEYDFGSTEKQWRTLYTQDLSASRDAEVTRTLYANTIINNTPDYVSIYGGWDESTGAFLRLSSSTASNPANRNRMMLHADQLLIGDVLDNGNYDPWMVRIHTDDRYIVLGSTLKDRDHFLTIHGDTSIKGNLSVDGNVYLSAGDDGTIYLGTVESDTVVFHADVDSSIIPEQTTTYDLGTSEQQWRELFVQDISATNDIFADGNLNVSGTGMIETDLVVSGHTNVGGNTVLSGTLDVKDRAWFHDDVYIMGDLRVDGNAWLSAGVDGVVNVGDKNTDSVIFHADVDSNIIPDDTITYDLGTSEQQWRELFVQDISATNDIFADGDFNLSGTGMIETDLVVSGHTNVGGNTVLSGTLDVKHDTTLHEDMFVSGHVVVSETTTLSGTLDVEEHAHLRATMTVDQNVGIGTPATTDHMLAVNGGTVSISSNNDFGNTVPTQYPALRVEQLGTGNVVEFYDSTAFPHYNHSIFKIDSDGHTAINWHKFEQLTYAFNVSGESYFKGANVGINATPDSNYSLYVEHDTMLHGNLTVDEDTILSGHLTVEDSAKFLDDVHIMGDLRVDGNAWLSAGIDGVINIGDKNTDNVIFRADVDSNIVPDDNITYDLGTSEQQWRELFTQDISASNDVFVDNNMFVSGVGTIETGLVVSGYTNVGGNTTLSGTLDVDDETRLHDTLDVTNLTTLHDDLHVSGDTVVAGSTTLSGTLDVQGFVTLHDSLSVVGDLHVDGNAYLSAGVGGVINVGDENTDNVVFNAYIDSGIVPDDDITFDLGTTSLQWNTLYVQHVSSTGHVNVLGDVLTDRVINNADSLSLHSGTDDTDGSFIRLVDDKVYIHADYVLFQDIDDGTNVQPQVLSISTDEQHVILNSTLYVADSAYFHDELVVNKETLLKSTLDVNDVATLHNNLLVSGHAVVSETTTLSGTLDVEELTTLHNDLHVSGYAAVDGDTTVGGSVFVKNNTTVDGNTVLSGTLTVVEAISALSDLYVDGNVWFKGDGSGTINLGDSDTDNVVFVADVDSNIIPDDTITYDLGTSSKQWRELFVQDISATNDIFTDGDLNVSGVGTFADNLNVSGYGTIEKSLVVSGNATVANHATVSGTLDVRGFTTLHDTLSVIGDLHVDGNAYLKASVDGTINVGDTDTDSVIFNADVDSNITPDDTITYDLGTSTQQWRELFVQDISATNDIFADSNLNVSGVGTIQDNLVVSGNTYIGGYLEVDTFGRFGSSIEVTSHATIGGNLIAGGFAGVTDDLTVGGTISAKGDLYVDGNVWFKGDGSGIINLGDSDTDNVVFVADVDSNIIPDDTITYDLGTSTQQWRELFVQDISATNDIFTDGDLSVSGNTTIESDLIVSGYGTIEKDLVVSGNSTASGTLDVHDVTTLHDDLYTSGRFVVSNTTTLSSTLDVTSLVTLNDSLQVSGKTSVLGDTTLSGTLDVDGHTMLRRNLSVGLDAAIGGDLSVTGDLTVDGNVWFKGDGSGIINLGDSDTDNVVFVADVDSNIIPDKNMTYDLGTVEQHWNTLYTHDVSAHGDVHVQNELHVAEIYNNNLEAFGLKLYGKSSTESYPYAMIEVGRTVNHYHAHGHYFSAQQDIDPDNTLAEPWPTMMYMRQNTGVVIQAPLTAERDVVFDQDLDAGGSLTVGGSAVITDSLTAGNDVTFDKDLYVKGSLVVDGHAYFGFGAGASLNLGETNQDKIVFLAEVDSNIIPDPTNTYTLGNNEQRWAGVYARNINADRIWINGGVGRSMLNETLVDGDLTVSGDISVTGQVHLNDNALRFSDSVTLNSQEVDTLKQTAATIENDRNRWETHQVILTKTIHKIEPDTIHFVELQGNSSTNPLENSQYKQPTWDNITYTYALVVPYDTQLMRVSVRGSDTNGANVIVRVHTNDSLSVNSPTDKENQLFVQQPFATYGHTYTSDYQTGNFTFGNQVSASAGATLGLSLLSTRELNNVSVTIILSQKQ